MLLIMPWGCESNDTSNLDTQAYGMLSLDDRAVTPVRIDLDSILARDTLRVLTRNSAYTYFLHRGTEMGFEYELAHDLAEKLGVNLRMVVPPSWDDMIPWLLAGKGDIIASAMTITPERERHVQFSHPYKSVHQVVLTRQSETPIQAPEDLAGKQVHVRAGSSYYRRLLEVNDEIGGGIEVVAVPEYYGTEYIIQLLMDRIIDVTVADENIAQIEQAHYDSLRIDCRISDIQQLAWAVRPGADSLLARVNEYIDDIYTSGRSAFYNILHRRHFEHPRRYDSFKTSLRKFRDQGQISGWDDLLKRHSDTYKFQFSLVAAQVYQESRFDPNAKSWVGAVGLMQLMPRTAEYLGVENINDPEQNVEAGVRYLRRLYDRLDDTIRHRDRLAFALASYNVGYSHLRDARKIAAEDDLNPDVWAGNVEWVLLNLSRSQYYERAAAGYARGHEGVNYVNNILDRAQTYQALLDGRDRDGKQLDDLARVEDDWFARIFLN
jgi:membrane-bound lytic murein transglycosylase F